MDAFQARYDAAPPILTGVKQVVQSLKSGEVAVVDVPTPSVRRGGALVLTHASLISTGTERAKIELGEKSLLGKARARPELAKQVIDKARQDGVLETYRTVMQRLEAPTPLGYSAAGEVIAVGSDCGGIKPGDLVACAGGGYANHAEVNFIPKNLLAKIPSGVSTEHAAYATLGAIAMQGVRQADVRARRPRRRHRPRPRRADHRSARPRGRRARARDRRRPGRLRPGGETGRGRGRPA